MVILEGHVSNLREGLYLYSRMGHIVHGDIALSTNTYLGLR